MLRRISKTIAASLVLVAAAVSPHAGRAQERLSFISDAEIEHTIRLFATPIFQAAGLDPAAVHIILVNDRRLNAFVAGGQNLFLNTGLLMRTENAGQVIGVIAHETGHMSGGHLARMGDEQSGTAIESVLAGLLGAAAAAAGRPDLGQAIMMGGQHIAMSGLLKFSRTQEAAADNAALHFLDETHESARGFLEFMQILSGQELVGDKYQDPYVRTHPLSADRVETIAHHVATSPYRDSRFSPEYTVMHQRMVAKLKAFLNPIAQTLREYPESKTDAISRYARAIALYRKPDLPAALAVVDGLIAESPGDPYYRELKGQVLFENGKVREAVEPYRTAVELVPDAPSIRVALARALIESSDDSFLDEAILNLRAALRADPDSPFVWRQLAVAYGRKGETAMGDLALAEEAIRRNKTDEAKFYAGRAAKSLPSGSGPWLQAQDILGALDTKAESKKK